MIDFTGDARGRDLMLFVERLKYERHLQDEVTRLLIEQFNGVADIMLSRGYRDLTIAQRQRLNAMLQEIARHLGKGYDEITTLVVDEMKQYAPVEASVSRHTVAGVLPQGTGDVSAILDYRLSKSYLNAIAKLTINGYDIGGWFAGRAVTMATAASGIIRAGLVQGKGTAEIARQIVASERATGAVLSKRAVNDARTITRTIVNGVQNNASMQSYTQLPESVSDSYLYVAVLDGRTSVQCAAASGRVFRYDDPRKLVPPLHPNCRSTTLPLIRGADESMEQQKRNPSLRNYADWLTAQPSAVQNDILGPTRAGLFRDGKMSLADAVDQDGRTLTLAQLREKLGLDAMVTQ